MNEIFRVMSIALHIICFTVHFAIVSSPRCMLSHNYIIIIQPFIPICFFFAFNVTVEFIKWQDHGQDHTIRHRGVSRMRVAAQKRHNRYAEQLQKSSLWLRSNRISMPHSTPITHIYSCPLLWRQLFLPHTDLAGLSRVHWEAGCSIE